MIVKKLDKFRKVKRKSDTRLKESIKSDIRAAKECYNRLIEEARTTIQNRNSILEAERKLLKQAKEKTAKAVSEQEAKIQEEIERKIQEIESIELQHSQYLEEHYKKMADCVRNLENSYNKKEQFFEEHQTFKLVNPLTIKD